MANALQNFSRAYYKAYEDRRRKDLDEFNKQRAIGQDQRAERQLQISESQNQRANERFAMDKELFPTRKDSVYLKNQLDKITLENAQIQQELDKGIIAMGGTAQHKQVLNDAMQRYAMNPEMGRQMLENPSFRGMFNLDTPEKLKTAYKFFDRYAENQNKINQLKQGTQQALINQRQASTEASKASAELNRARTQAVKEGKGSDRRALPQVKIEDSGRITWVDPNTQEVKILQKGNPKDESKATELFYKTATKTLPLFSSQGVAEMSQVMRRLEANQISGSDAMAAYAQILKREDSSGGGSGSNTIGGFLKGGGSNNPQPQPKPQPTNLDVTGILQRANARIQKTQQKLQQTGRGASAYARSQNRNEER